MKIITPLLLFGFLAGCIIGPTDPPYEKGYLYGNTEASVLIAQARDGKPTGAKRGEACTTAIAGPLVQYGDMSVKKAASDAGIVKVNFIDYSSLNILSLYHTKCVIVIGD